jgi:hypothetical protein
MLPVDVVRKVLAVRHRQSLGLVVQLVILVSQRLLVFEASKHALVLTGGLHLQQVAKRQAVGYDAGQMLDVVRTTTSQRRQLRLDSIRPRQSAQMSLEDLRSVRYIVGKVKAVVRCDGTGSLPVQRERLCKVGSTGYHIGSSEQLTDHLPDLGLVFLRQSSHVVDEPSLGWRHRICG